MAENTDTPENPAGTPDAVPTEQEQPTTVAAAAAPPAPEPAPVAQPRLRDTVYTFRAMIAVAVATLLLGGAGGAALVALVDDDHDTVRIGRVGPGDRGFRGPQLDGQFPGPGVDGPRFRQDGPGDQRGQDGQDEVQPAPGDAS